MIWFIIGLAIVVFVGSLIDFSCNGWDLTKQFFTDSGWGMIAIIAGFISLLLFYASSKSYKDLKINESFLPNPKNFNKQNKGRSAMSVLNKDNQIIEYDLSQLTMKSLVKKMAYEMTKPGPVFFKGWGNHRLEFDVERVKIIGRYITSLRDTGNELMQLHADSILSFETIEKLTLIKRNDLQKQLEQSKVDLNFVKFEYQHRIKIMSLEEERLEEDILMQRALREKVETENLVLKLKSEAEYQLMIAKGLKETQVALILAEAVKYFNELPAVLKSYVTVQLGNENAENPDKDMELQEQVKEFVIRKQNAEARKIEYEADENEAKKDTLKAKLERERLKYLDNGKI
ncbi:MAG: hypothetical protein WC644_04345 [Ignavibacteria bacterium]